MSDGPPASPTRFTAAAPRGRRLPTDVVTYGPGIPTEAELRLLGGLEGKRVLDLGCGAGSASIAFALAGAKVIAVDPDPAQVEATRLAAEAAGVRVEVQQASPAELAFVRADGIDVAFSAYALAEVVDLDRVFRQVHRVLKQEAPLVFSLPHPALAVFGVGGASGTTAVRRYDDASPYDVDRGDDRVTDTPRTTSAVFTSLTRANFKVDQLLEPMARRSAVPDAEWHPALEWVPPALVLRARKQGI